MSKRRQQMHGKTFGGIKWSRYPENHNRLRATDQRITADVQAFNAIARAASRAVDKFAAAFLAFGRGL